MSRTRRHSFGSARRWSAVASVTLMMAGACGSPETGDPAPTAGTAAEPAATASVAPSTPAGPAPSLPPPNALWGAWVANDWVAYSVTGRVSVGGRTWTIPATYLFQDLTVEEPQPLLSSCAPFRMTSDSPSVVAAHQTTLDKTAGDHVSVWLDGEQVMGGAFAAGTGQEWSWSVETWKSTMAGPGARFLLIWWGEAAENFTSDRSVVVGWVECRLDRREVVQKWTTEIADAVSEASEAAEEHLRHTSEALEWSTRPEQPGITPTNQHTERFGDDDAWAISLSSYPSDSHDDLVDHYREAYGRPPDSSSETVSEWDNGDGAPGRPSTGSAVVRTGGEVVVADRWRAP